jgi:hypothetical protein
MNILAALVQIWKINNTKYFHFRRYFANNDWCKSLGTNVGLDCEFAQAARKLILFTSDRAKSKD